MKLKAFTLLQLLVVLAIISVATLFLTPYVLNKVETANKANLEANSHLYIERLETHLETANSSYKPGYYDVSLLNTNLDTKTSDGWVIIGYDNKIEAGILEFNDITQNMIVIYYDSKVEILDYSNEYINPEEITTKNLKKLIELKFENVSINAIIE